jgi:hypothetical protein
MNDQRKKVVEGAMRLAAIEKMKFEATGFLSKSEIFVAPDRVDSVFPRLSVRKVREKSGCK